MSYGTPTPQSDARSYEVQMFYVPISGAGNFTTTVSFSNVADEAATDASVQAFVDLISTSPDWTITVARKATPSSQTIIPT